MSDLGDYINGNISKALKSRKSTAASASQESGPFSRPSEVGDISRPVQRLDGSNGSGLISGDDGSGEGTQNALKQRQKKNSPESYPAIDQDEKY